jgi:hypothetical protein
VASNVVVTVNALRLRRLEMHPTGQPHQEPGEMKKPHGERAEQTAWSRA